MRRAFHFFVLSCPRRHRSVRRRRARPTTPAAMCRGPYWFVCAPPLVAIEHGFTEFCQVPAPKLDRDIVGSMLDVMPAPRLIFQQWEERGPARD